MRVHPEGTLDLESLAKSLAPIPGVVAVVLGGSRAQGRHRPDSDWDFGLYYRGHLDTDAIRALRWEGDATEPGAWAYPMNGGAWLTISRPQGGPPVPGSRRR